MYEMCATNNLDSAKEQGDLPMVDLLSLGWIVEHDEELRCFCREAVG